MESKCVLSIRVQHENIINEYCSRYVVVILSLRLLTSADRAITEQRILRDLQVVIVDEISPGSQVVRLPVMISTCHWIVISFAVGLRHLIYDGWYKFETIPILTSRLACGGICRRVWIVSSNEFWSEGSPMHSLSPWPSRFVLSMCCLGLPANSDISSALLLRVITKPSWLMGFR